MRVLQVYHKEKTQRNNRRGLRDTTDSAIENATSLENPHASQIGRPSLRHVDSIVEDEEDTSIRSPPPSSFTTSPTSRARQTSFTTMQSMQLEQPGRMRSISIPEVPHPRYEDGITRKTGTASRVTPQPSVPSQVSGGAMRNGNYNGSFKDLPGQPQKTRRIGRHRESLDLDEIMGGSDEEENEEPPIRTSKTTTTRSSSSSTLSPTSSKNPGTPHISRAARELIAFLEEGPPDEPRLSSSPSVNASVISFESSSKTKSGRLQRMISRLTVGGSTERLNGRGPSEDSEQTTRSLSRKPSNKVISTSPPSFRQTSLSSKRSLPNVIVATPPPPPPVIPISQTPPVLPQLSTPPMSSASSSQASVDEMGSIISSPRRPVRKAAPAWEERDGFPMPPSSPLPPMTPITVPTTPTYGVEPITPRTPVRRTTNGHVKPVVVPVAGEANDVQILETPPRAPPSTRHANGSNKSSATKVDTQDEVPASPKTLPPAPTGPRSFVSKPRTPTTPTPSTEKATLGPNITTSAVDDLRQLLALATTADECRLLVDMFFARQGIPYRSPSAQTLISKDTCAKINSHNDNLENMVVEILLGGGDVDEVSAKARNVAEDSPPAGKVEHA